MKTFSISKYNPEFRSKTGGYLKNDWTSSCDIGKLFDDGILSKKKYLNVEGNYLSAIQLILDELNSETMKVVGLEKFETNLGDEEFETYSKDIHDLFEKVEEGSLLSIDESLSIVKLMLRERIWCYLVNKDVTIRVGYDFHIDSVLKKQLNCFSIIENKLNLFVVQFKKEGESTIEDFLDEI